jgi:hypothetical protein
MRKTIISAGLAAAALAALVAFSGPGANAAEPAAGSAAVQPADVDPTPFGCRNTVACFYDDHARTNLIWTLPGAPDCEIIDLRKINPPMNDRISAVYNRLVNQHVELFTWDETTAQWTNVDTVWTGRQAVYNDERDNTVDGVRVC